MKLDQQTFERIMAALKGGDVITYDNNARLFCGGEGTPFPEFEEDDGNVHSSYILYATVDGRTLPLEHGMNSSLTDKSRAMEIPRGANMPCAYDSGLASHFNKPLEVLAIEIPGTDGKTRPKWDLWMVRNVGEQSGYIHDSLAGVLAGR